MRVVAYGINENVATGLLKFTSTELKNYIEILTDIDVSDSSLEIQNLQSQLLRESQNLQLREPRISSREKLTVGMKELWFSRFTEEKVIAKLVGKITELEGVDNKTKQQTDELALLHCVYNAQEEDVLPLKNMLERNKLYIIRKIGLETFVLSNTILDRKMNSLVLNHGLGSHPR